MAEFRRIAHDYKSGHEPYWELKETHWACCLMTTLDNTVLSDRTTATAVSSADDSNAANFSENATRNIRECC